MRETRDGRRHLRQKTQANQFAIKLLAPDYLMEPFYSDDPDLQGLEIALKGGQMGTPDYFGWIKKGGGAAERGRQP